MSEQSARPSDQPEHHGQTAGEGAGEGAGGVQPPPYGQYGPGYGERPPGQQPGPGPQTPSQPSYGPQAPPSGPQQPYGPPGYQQGYGPPGHQQGYGRPRGEMSPQDQRLWACLAHVSAIAAGLLLSGVSAYAVYLGAVGPLVLYFVFRERGAFVRRQTAEALNFQILLTIVYLALVLLSVVTLGLGLFVSIPAIIVIAVVALVFEIIAAVRANAGVDYRYPVNWRLVR